MSWIQKLFETYEACQGREPEGSERLLPVSHALQQAHVEIIIDGDGNFVSAKTIGKTETVIPATESSSGRTGKRPPPHPLCDKIQYCAADYPLHSGKKPSFYKEYQAQLADWCASAFSHAKARAVLAYVRKQTLVADLLKEGVLISGEGGKLLTRWNGEGQPELFKVLTAKAGERDQGDAFIRWQVREPDNLCTAVWLDESLQDAWAKYDASTKATPGVCMVTGQSGINLALSHPKRLRHAGDGAKLISANDSSGFTFRGRFTDDSGQQACGVGFEVTQKAHNALRWLIQRQAYRNGDQAIVSWAVGGAPIPDPFGSSLTLMLAGAEATGVSSALVDNDVGQAFAKRLNLALNGYRARLGPTDDIVVMGLDSATPGRMAVTYYRELTGSEFLVRVERWQTDYAWHQNFGKDKHFVGAPAPHDIAAAAYGRRLDEKLKKATIERLLPCIVDGQPLPRDLMEMACRRASHRTGFEGRKREEKDQEWEKTLGIACALFRGYHSKENYPMVLEANRRTRDYLYGRLLAVADQLERAALRVANENRETTAARLMQRFADHPCSTWRTIYLALAPYKSRLRAKYPGLLYQWEVLLDEINCAFDPEEFISEGKLSGEFLLGFHCQRLALQPTGKRTESANEPEAEE